MQTDTLHRFWKKEHDWGWIKFMKLSKVSDGFIFTGTLMIKAQVQVIRYFQFTIASALFVYTIIIISLQISFVSICYNFC